MKFFLQKHDVQQQTPTLATQVRRSPLSLTEMLSTNFCTGNTTEGVITTFHCASARAPTRNTIKPPED